MARVYRCYACKREGFDVEANALLSELKEHLRISELTYLCIFNRYDVQGIDDTVYTAARNTVFSEPMCDEIYDERLPDLPHPLRILAVEALPGQYDQRADSCAQCIQIITRGTRPLVRTAKLYILGGEIDDEVYARIRSYLINPVDCREAAHDKPDTLDTVFHAPAPVAVLDGFTQKDREDLNAFLTERSLAMDIEDLLFLQRYFRDTEQRDPTMTEIRVLDTYWSDHCRHTTFSTRLEDGDIEDEAVKAAYDKFQSARKEIYGDLADLRPVTLMDVATAGVKLLKKRGLLQNLDESDEINACTVRIRVDVNGSDEDWLLLFKNETHNHPTEIEPFGGAATCLGGCIRDPLSGRAYVYQAMRVTGCGDPTVPLSATLPGKLPQRRLTVTAAAGYSSYGNQIGLATGLVHEIYHPGYIAKRLELGAVVGAVPAENVRRETPIPGDIVLLIGGRTGRDGCGGATGSSKSHDEASLSACSAEVQKGNPPEERKIQRLFRNPAVACLIKRCNDFGAGGVSVAVGELADGILINLDAVPKKYEGLDGTELAISESQERMAVVVGADDADRMIYLASEENLEAVIIATITKEPRMVMLLDGRRIVDVSRSFLSSNGAPKQAVFRVPELPDPPASLPLCCGGPQKWMETMAADLNVCSQRGLVQRFDGSIGAVSVLMPFGGRFQLTPTQVMAAKLPVPGNNTNTCSVMSFGYDPALSSANPFVGAACAVTESIAKLIAAGVPLSTVYLTLQEYFERMRNDPERWGKPMASLLGAFIAQTKLGIASIGGKDSMSGSFNDLDVPPTLVSFAIGVHRADAVISPEFKKEGSPVYVFAAPYGSDGLPDFEAVRAGWNHFTNLAASGKILSAWALTCGGAAEAVMKMGFGNGIGFAFDKNIDVYNLFAQNYGGIIAECDGEISGGVLLGHTAGDGHITFPDGRFCELSRLLSLWEGRLRGIFPVTAPVGEGKEEPIRPICYEGGTCVTAPAVKLLRPTAVIPVFPGTNCEYDTASAVERAGGKARIIVIGNLTPSMLADSARALESAIADAQMLILPGGFSGGDEPEGSGKFIAAFFRNPVLTEAVENLLYQRDGLVLGICNGFQALIKLGLVPYGHICELSSDCPTLTFNRIGRHQSLYVRTRVCSNLSPWLSLCRPGELHMVPVSHGEGRFAASPSLLEELEFKGQIAFQYVSENGLPSMDITVNPNGSALAVEGITSPDGRVLGKMGHTERAGENVAKNITGPKNQKLFEAGVNYFR